MTKRGFPFSVVLPFAVVGVIGVYFTIFWSIWATSFAYDRGWSAKPAAYNDPLGALLVVLPLTLVTFVATAFGWRRARSAFGYSRGRTALIAVLSAAATAWLPFMR